MLYQTSEDLRYAYTCGQLKVRENRLLSRRDLKRLFTTGKLEEISAILLEAGYILPEKKEGILEDIDGFLTLNLKKLYTDLEKLSFHPELNSLFLLRYDFRNFGILLKEALAVEAERKKDESRKEALVDLGLYGLKPLEDSLRRKNFEIYPEEVSEIFLKIEKEATPDKEDRLNQIIDQEYLKLALKISAKNPFCHLIFKTIVDFTNLKNCLRFKEIGKDEEGFSKIFIEGGIIPKGELNDLFLTRLSLTQLLTRYSYHKLLSGETKEELGEIDKRADDFLIDTLRESSFFPIGVESVIAHLVIKEKEALNLLLLFRGKRAALKEEEVFPTLRKTYV